MKKVVADGTVWLDKNGDCHRDDDLPAMICDNGKLHWFQHGKRHRDGDKPAYEYNGDRIWCKDGLIHREMVDEQGNPLPAIISPRWTKWVRNGAFSNPGHDWVAKLPDGTKGYYKNSELHFENGVIHTLKDGVTTDRIINPVQDEQTHNEELKCSICMENKKCIVFNCGHLCSCHACSERLDICPVCRVKISSKMRVYI
jgi:hypothetical protein